MSFRVNVIVRILLALLLGAASIYFWVNTAYWLVSGWMVLFFVLTVVNLIRYVERSDRELSDFLLAIQQNDFTNKYPQTQEKSKRLFRAFNLITSQFIQLRNEKESNFHFLKTMVEHSGVPLMAYHMISEEVTMINKALKDLFGIPYFSKLSSLHRVDSTLVGTLKSLGANEKVLVKVQIKGEVSYLSLIANEVVISGERNKLLAFHNINAELDQKEVDSWQKLIRVMTHEIKNSVIPIATLAEVINDMVVDQKLTELNSEDEEDLLLSMKTIEKRSKGLVRFVTNYGDLARVPKPDFQETDLVSIVEDVLQLEQKVCNEAGITVEKELPDSPKMRMLDPEMIEQVLINLLKNAIEALNDGKVSNPQIRINLEMRPMEVIVAVTDNGPGMDQETQEQVFIPFFTTKEKGSGIGLSYSKQIMRAHKGNLRVKSRPGEGTTFEMVFMSF